MEELHDRRAGPRAGLEESAVFKEMEVGENGRFAEFKAAKVTNVSIGGLCAEFESKQKQGAILRMNFFHEGSGIEEHEAIKVMCEVLWSKAGENGAFMTGLQFISVKDEDSKKLLAYINEKQKTKRAF